MQLIQLLIQEIAKPMHTSEYGMTLKILIQLLHEGTVSVD